MSLKFTLFFQKNERAYTFLNFKYYFSFPSNSMILFSFYRPEILVLENNI